jgi:adenosine deaminase
LPDKIGLRTFCHLMPKAEIHCHLFGTIRKDTLIGLNERAGKPLETQELESFYVRGDKPKGVLHIFRLLDGQLIQTCEDLHQITLEYLEDAKSHNVHYSEFFWNPTGTSELSGISFEKAQNAIHAATCEAQKRFDIISRLIPSIDREAPSQKALEMVRNMIDHRHQHTIGIGIDYREPDGPPQDFIEAYQLARDAGYHVTAHAGEFGMPAGNVKIALDDLGVSRIDHGYTILDDPELTRRCADAGTVFTVVPTNSFYIRTLTRERWALDHPMRRMPREGLRIHPNTDDPAFHLVTPTDTWLMMVEQFGFNLDHLRQFMINGLDGAWLPDDIRQKWKKQWSREFDALRARLDEEPLAAADQNF